ncbi:hypothetical protein ACFFWC_26050 [Plantactinospora siamensis]|uniref:BMP family ABC transporter substrate-binding protein n=1 Tax=Plantactinospora siamensis TaxID=555372 RepID=A0ABV6P5Y3_9ACTN
MPALSRRQWILAGLAALVVLTGLVTWLVWPSGGEAPRERRYGSFTACLLTDDKGLAGEQARASWAGMQQASLATAAKVQYLSVAGAQTPSNAASYFNSLGVQRCGLIVAVGPGPVAATAAGHGQFPGVRYLIVGSSPDPALPAVPAAGPDAITAAVRDRMTEAVHNAPK